MIRAYLFSVALLTSAISHAQCTYLPQGILDAWSQDRSLWASEVGYEPVMTGAYPELVITSYRVTHLDTQSFLFDSGIRSGDELLAVNGVSVSNQNAFRSVVERLTDLPEIVLSLKEKEPVRFLNSVLDSTLQCSDIE
ncbi:hypothetical protein [Litoribrevibacter albus]|uniref:PDZ domain-containing protein n=1 Tax=Litoribrevibacter albus TaxID=1473156 RepID=A0AA37S6E1_9GAMM|nr:hypothetical protein [Litoribrevibacter albus]GLQ30060.1 hypothetical protein GCM10007876_05380 [Litoribrevibacter albus]